MSELIIHLGAFKTASTSIQYYFTQNRNQLKQYGILYPESDSLTNQRGNHSYLQVAISRSMRDSSPSALEEQKLALSKEITLSSPHLVLLSSEHFWPREPLFAETLINFAKDLFSRIRVIIYIRPQRDLWISLYSQMAKEMNILPADKPWGGDFIGSDVKMYGMQYGSILDTYSMLIGRENIIARLYDRNLFPNGDSVRDFMDLCGLPADQLPNPSKNLYINQSWAWKGVELSKYLALHFKSRFACDPDYRVAAKSALRKTVGIMNNDGYLDWAGRTSNYLSEKEQDSLHEYYLPNNLVLFQKYFAGQRVISYSEPLPRDAGSLSEICPQEFCKALNIFFDHLNPSAKETFSAQ